MIEELIVTQPERASDIHPCDKASEVAKILHENFPEVECRVEHDFIPGCYIRTTHMPTGSAVVSKIHLTRHPFVVLQGEADVWTETTGRNRVRAPFCGITEAGTQRVLYIITDSIWRTFHTTNETDLEKIEAEIIQKQDILAMKTNDNKQIQG